MNKDKKRYGQWYIEPYGNVNFIPSIIEVKRFSACSQNMDFIPSAKKKHQNWSICNLLFCSEIGCYQVFKSKEDLETHLVKGCEKTGGNDAARLSMDNVKVFLLLKWFTHHRNIVLF